jgi:hypothetical protein
MLAVLVVVISTSSQAVWPISRSPAKPAGSRRYAGFNRRRHERRMAERRGIRLHS